MIGIIKYSVDYIPGRKRPVLLKNTPGISYVVGYFKNEEEAQEFEDFMKVVMKALRSSFDYKALNRIFYSAG